METLSNKNPSGPQDLGICGTCRHWTGYKRPEVAEHRASCRRYPPQVTLETEWDEDGDKYLAPLDRYPVTNANEFCGEYAVDTIPSKDRTPQVDDISDVDFTPDVDFPSGSEAWRHDLWSYLFVPVVPYLKIYDEMCMAGLKIQARRIGTDTHLVLHDPSTGADVHDVCLCAGRPGEYLKVLLDAVSWKKHVATIARMRKEQREKDPNAVGT